MDGLGHGPRVSVRVVTPRVPKVVAFKYRWLVNWDLGSEGWVGEKEVHLPKERAASEVIAPCRRVLKGVRLEQPARAVVVHDHVHLGRFDEVWV